MEPPPPRKKREKNRGRDITHPSLGNLFFTHVKLNSKNSEPADDIDMASVSLLESDTPVSGPRRFMHRASEELGLTSLYHSQYDVRDYCLCSASAASSPMAVLPCTGSLHAGARLLENKHRLLRDPHTGGRCRDRLCLTLFADAIGRKRHPDTWRGVDDRKRDRLRSVRQLLDLTRSCNFGVISPSGNEIGPFRAVEENVVAHLTTSATRSDIYAWYTLLGNAGDCVQPHGMRLSDAELG